MRIKRFFTLDNEIMVMCNNKEKETEIADRLCYPIHNDVLLKNFNLIALKWGYSLVFIHLNDVSFVLLSILFKYAFMHFI